MNSIIQDWACNLGLRHQGTLVSAIRGCDGALRDDPSKWLVRFYRSCVLNAFVGDPAKAKSYMQWPKDDNELFEQADKFFKAGLDHYPMHWLTHFMFATEILGYYYPLTSDNHRYEIRNFWNVFYHTMVKKLHLYPETKDQLDSRLNANEETFGQQQI